MARENSAAPQARPGAASDEWRCRECGALLGVEDGGVIRIRYKDMEWEAAGDVRVRCRRCQTWSERMPRAPAPAPRGVCRNTSAHAPRPDQVESLAKIGVALDAHDRAQAIMACGTGKTWIAYWAAEARAASLVGYFAPSIALVAQTLREWATLGLAGPALVVCSDVEVARQEDIDALAMAGIPAVTTRAADVAAFMAGDGPRVVLSTYDSASRVAEAQDGGSPAFDFVALDEAHNLAGRRVGGFADVLDAARIRASKRLFLTATPRIYDDAAGGAVSMDDESIFGPVAVTYSFGRAIADGVISDYQIALVEAWHEPLAATLNDGDGADAAAVVAVAKALRMFDLRQVVTFHNLVRRARGFAEALPNVAAQLREDERPTLPVWAAHIDGAMHNNQRAEILSRLASFEGHAVVCNARVLAEGVNMVALDGVAIIDPKHSRIAIVQAISRGLRKSGEGNVATIIIPVYVSPGTTEDDVAEMTDFGTVWSVLRALREHDDGLEARLRWVERGAGEESDGVATDPVRPNFRFIASPLLMDALRPMLVKRSSLDPWADRFEEFKSRWPDALTDMDRRWLCTQRATERGQVDGAKMTPDRRARLESLPGWVWRERTQEPWAARMARLAAHWPLMVDERDRRFINDCRSRHRRGGLSGDKARELEALDGWAWAGRGVGAGFRWWRRLERVRSCWPDRLSVKDAAWLRLQKLKRAGYKAGLPLSADRAAALGALDGWRWEPRFTPTPTQEGDGT